MKILFLTLLDFSSVEEKGIYTDLMREFINENHEVYIISPTEKRYKQPTRLFENKNNKILKLQIGNTQKTNILEKGISTLTLEAIFKKAIKRYFSGVTFDLVLYTTPPITLQKAIAYVKKRDNAKTYLLLKDIFPQNAVDLGLIKSSGIEKVILRYFRKKEKKLYKVSDYIGCMSRANVDYLLAHNPQINSSTVEICPNSINPIEIDSSNRLKRSIKIKYDIPLDKTVFIYGGNLGKPQGIDFLIKCLEANKNHPNAYFVIVGSGTEYHKLEKYFMTSKPENAQLLTHLPRNEYELLANSCDVGLLFLDKRFTIPNFPSRILSYMEASMPVLAATDSNTDIGEVIIKGEFGYWSKSNDLESFNEKLEQLCNEKLRESLGENARKYLENHYTTKHSYEIIISHFD